MSDTTLTETDLIEIREAIEKMTDAFSGLTMLYGTTTGDPNEVLWMERDSKWCGSFDEVFNNEFRLWRMKSLEKVNRFHKEIIEERRERKKELTQKFRTCVEQVAQSEINNVDPMNLPMLVESLLERCWENDKEGFYKAYEGVINNEEGV
jgi:hypothetical protein